MGQSEKGRHHLQEEGQGEEQSKREERELPPPGRLPFPPQGFPVTRQDGPRLVAGAPHRLDEVCRGDTARIETDLRPFGGEIHLRLDPGQRIEHLLDAGGAGGAGHAVKGEIDALGRHLEAAFANEGDEVGGRYLARVVDDTRFFRGQIDLCLHPRLAVQGLLDPRRTGGTGHALNG
jgi:hypothetical protein